MRLGLGHFPKKSLFCWDLRVAPLQEGYDGLRLEVDWTEVQGPFRRAEEGQWTT